MTDHRSEAAVRIDMHSHVIPPAWPDWGKRCGSGPWPNVIARGDGATMLMIGDKPFCPVDERFWSGAKRIADMDRLRVDVQVLSPVPVMTCYWADAEANRRFARMLNEHIAAMVAENPSRFVGMATLPMQDPKLAVRELQHARETLQIRSVQIGSTPAGRELDDPALFPFFEACADLGMSIFVHPLDPVVGRERLTDYYLNNALGNVMETAIAMSRLICGGVLERLPKLRVCFAHAGGAFPYVLGRLDRAFHVRPETRKHITRPPSEWAKSIYVDSQSLDHASLRFAIEKHGVDRVLMGSDYPFGLGEPDPVGFVETAGLNRQAAFALMDTNVRSFLSFASCGAGGTAQAATFSAAGTRVT
jgi:aminocarboxymuconate-semialdehyde decarboxylase